MKSTEPRRFNDKKHDLQFKELQYLERTIATLKHQTKYIPQPALVNKTISYSFTFHANAPVALNSTTFKANC